MTLREGTVIGGRYEIIEKLGSGGMAIVYKATDMKLDRYVTLKAMREEYIDDEDFCKRFDVEARAVAKLSNQNIVSVYDVGQDGDVHYIIMEYIEGVTLKDLIWRHAPFADDELLGVSIQIASALEHAHRNGIIHRDIKPQNILVTPEGFIKVTDFGIARTATVGTISAKNTTLGSVHYFSPEQARGGFVDNKSDIYALGIVMFEMAAGEVPFKADTPIAVALMQINDPLPDLTEYNKDISPSIIRIIQKATEKQAGGRYQSAGEMAADLKRAMVEIDGDGAENPESPAILLTSEDIDAINQRPRNGADGQTDQSGKITGGLKKNGKPAPNEPYAAKRAYYPDDSAEKKKERIAILFAIATSFVIIALVIYIASRILIGVHAPASMGPGGPSPGVPSSSPAALNLDLRGMTVDQANAAAQSAGVNLVKTREENSDTVPAGSIISQEVEGGGELYAGGTLDVVVSKGRELVAVPDLTMHDISDASGLLAGTDLTVNNTNYIYDNNIPRNVIITQDPAAGSQAARGSGITVYVSKGKEIVQVRVPNVVGMTEADAISTLQDAGFVVGLSRSQSSARVPEGCVISQSVDGGKMLDSGSVVTYVLSSGPPQPSATATPPPQPPRPAAVSKTLTVPLTITPQGNTVHLYIIRITESGQDNQPFFDNDVPVGDFPYKLTATGTGLVQYQIYFLQDGQSLYQNTVTLDFSNGGGASASAPPSTAPVTGDDQNAGQAPADTAEASPSPPAEAPADSASPTPSPGAPAQ